MVISVQNTVTVFYLSAHLYLLVTPKAKLDLPSRQSSILPFTFIPYLFSKDRLQNWKPTFSVDFLEQYFSTSIKQV